MRARSVFFLAALFGATAFAQTIPPSPIAQTTLLIDAASVKKDVPVWAAVHFTMPEGWHIYWQNPGDSGIPTTLQWTLPEGITAGAIQWPTPQRVATGDLVNYGYSHEATLLVPLTPTQDEVTGDVTLQARWLVCSDICIPEKATLSAPLRGNPEAAALLAQARAQLPTNFEGTASYQANAAQVVLALQADQPFTTAAKMEFFPLEDGIMRDDAPQQFSVQGNRLTLTTPRGEAELATPWHGLLKVADGEKTMAWQITATQSTTPLPVVSAPVPVTLFAALTLAFLGGLLLNIMPCVLPILALKALAIARKAEVSRASAARQGIAYTLGVILSFLAIAGLLFALKAGGAAIGWGFQLQNPFFVSALGVVMLLVAANLFGLFSLPVLFGTHAHEVNESSRFGSFLTGALAVLVATPCSAPFMATAMGATLSFATLPALAVFATLGFGMASPFLLISLWPAARRLLPKPGAWMHRFKQWLALPMVLTALWLFWIVLQMQGGTTPSMHEPYSPARLQQLRAAGTPVLVDATAAWCLTCKINERVALDTPAMQQFFREKNITLLVADWTTSDAAITDYLAQFGRNGVPLYVYYPPKGAPVVLPQLLTPSLVKQAVK